MKLYLDHSSGLSALFGGIFIGSLQTFFTISIAVLIFSGKLTSFLSSGISMMLIGYIVLSLIIAAYGSLGSSISSIQEAPAIVLMVIIHSIILKNPTINNHELFAIVTSIIVITTSMTGLFFYLLGKFKLGGLVRYMPYPVIAGFLAGTGWAMLQGGFELALGEHQNLSLAILLSDDYLTKWLSGLILGSTLFFTLKRYKNIAILPVTITAAILIFYLIIGIQDISIAEIKTHGWLLGPLPDISDKTLAVFNIDTIDWIFVLQQIMTDIPVIVLVSSITLLLNINAIEILTKQDINLNKSLKVTGIANLIAGLCGSTVGFAAVDMTSLSYKMNIINRFSILISILAAVLFLYFCLPALNFLPDFIIAGFLIYLGIDFLYEWVYSVWFKLNRTDYAIVLLVMLMTILIGFIEGISIGIGLALLLFVINFSRVSIINNSLSGNQLQSNNHRGVTQQQLLIDQGKQIQIIILTGFIFFGTANKLCVQLIKRAISKELPTLKYIILDWRQVTGIDASTVYSLQKIQRLSTSYAVKLIFTNVPKHIKSILDKNLLADSSLKYLPELNHGLDWCENEILAIAKKDNIFSTLETILVDSGVSATEVGIIASFFTKKEIPDNYYLIRQGDREEKLYFIESGCLDVFAESNTGKRTYLQRISMGLFVGEIGFFLKQPRTASIVTTKPSIIYEITLDDFELMKKNEIAAHAEFERVIILLLAKRLFLADAKIKCLLNSDPA